MKTKFRVKEPYAKMFLECADKEPCHSPVRPEHFIEVMKNNKGYISMLSGKGLDENGLERRNPVIAALGDSVTAGQFEPFLSVEEIMEIFTKMANGQPVGEIPPINISDTRESYIEKFRMKLIDKYETTSVSVVNAGIGGDNLLQMEKRLERDILSLQPDLVLVNGSLNWDPTMGTTEDFEASLRRIIHRIRNETKADIILLTPNGELRNTQMFGSDAPEPSTPERVEVIRRLASEEQVCLSDTYAVWERARDMGCPWIELLANGSNHPSVEGHEVYAVTLMKLFED